MSNAIKIDLLRRARTYIETKTHWFICYALAETGEDINQKQLADELSCNITDIQLGEHLFLESWLRKYRPDLPNERDDKVRYRFKWIDEMIRRLENNEPFVPLTSLDIFHV